MRLPTFGPERLPVSRSHNNINATCDCIQSHLQPDPSAKQPKYQLVPFISRTSCCGWRLLRKLCSCLCTKQHRCEVLPLDQVEAIIPVQSADSKGKKTLVLDLDETLVHSSFQEVKMPDTVLSVLSEAGEQLKIYVKYRPGLSEFLAALAPIYELVVFTASLPNYADQLLDIIDPDRLIQARLFRDSCTKIGNIFIKDLSLLGRDMSQILLIDVRDIQNSPDASLLQPSNNILVKSYLGESEDMELLRLIPLLKDLARVKDVRELLRKGQDLTSSSLVINTNSKRHSDLTDGTVSDFRPEFSLPR